MSEVRAYAARIEITPPADAFPTIWLGGFGYFGGAWRVRFPRRGREATAWPDPKRVLRPRQGTSRLRAA